MNKIPQKNEVVIFRKRKELSLGVLISSSADQTSIFSEEGKEVSINISRIVHGTGIKYKEGMSHADTTALLRTLRKEIEEIRPTVDLLTLWECVVGSPEEITFDELKELYFEPGACDPFNDLLLLWGIDKDQVYFKRVPEGYIPRSPEEAETLRLKLEIERKKAEKRNAAIELAKAVKRGEEVDANDENFQEYLDHIRNFVIYLDKYEKAPDTRSFMSEVGIKNVDEAIEFLIKIGYWSENDDPMFLRLGISTTFPRKVVKESADILNAPVSFDGLMDLTSISTYSIDDLNTQDIDDAISISETSDGPVLGIHIADVVGFVKNGSNLDQEAFKRGETIYLPEGHVHMFPNELIKDRLSLFEGERKRALSLMVYFDNDLEITNFTFINTKIRVDKNLTYQEAEDVLRSSVNGSKLFDIADKLRNQRLDAGGWIIDLPDLKIRVDKEGTIDVKTVMMTSPAHVLIAECMILMNRLSGQFLHDNKVPGIYRHLTEHISDEIKTLDPDDPLYPLKSVKFLRPSAFSVVALPHLFLGVDCYMQVTSPIRRYLDLVMQRQIIHKVRGLPIPYTGNELQRIYQQVQMEIKDKKMVERTRTKFWLYKYLQGLEGDIIRGVVSDLGERQLNVYFEDYLLDLPIPMSAEGLFNVGDYVDFVIENVNPIKRKIVLNPASHDTRKAPGFTV